jgi:hypothetical protein
VIRLRFLSGLSLLLLACSSVAIEPDDGGTGGAGTSSSSAHGTSATSAPVTSTGSGAGGEQFGFGGFGGGPSADCPADEAYFIEHTVEVLQLFDSGCFSEVLPNARFYPGGKDGGPSTWIDACAPLGAPDSALIFAGGTSVVSLGGGALTGSVGPLSFVDTTVTFDAYGDVGEPVKGSYVGKVMTSDGEVRDASGVFTLCRGPDLPPAP